MVEPFEPIINLASFENFMNFSKVDQTGRIMIRNKIVGLFSDSDDYEETIQDFKLTALKTYWREDTIYGLVVSRDVVKAIHRKYGSRYIPNQYDMNNIFIYKVKNRFAKKDQLSFINFEKMRDLPNEFAKMSISPLEEMTALNQMSFSTSSPLLVAFIDPSKEVQTQQFLDDIEYLGTKYVGKVNFVWVDYRDNLPLKKRLGLEGFQ